MKKCEANLKTRGNEHDHLQFMKEYYDRRAFATAPCWHWNTCTCVRRITFFKPRLLTKFTVLFILSSHLIFHRLQLCPQFHWLMFRLTVFGNFSVISLLRRFFLLYAHSQPINKSIGYFSDQLISFCIYRINWKQPKCEIDRALNEKNF